MRILLNFMILLMVSFSTNGCKNDNEVLLSETVPLKITVAYKNKTGIHTDIYAQIYIYYNIYTTDIANYKYASDGNFIFKDKLKVPDISLNMDGKESSIIQLDCSKKITILAESSFHKNDVILNSFPPGKEPITCTFIFNQD